MNAPKSEIPPLAAEIDRLRALNVELVEALCALLDAHAENCLFNNAGHWEQARAALAKATQP